LEKKYDTSGTQGHPRRATGGVHEFITTNEALVQNQGGVITAPDFNTFLREGFTYGSARKTLFAGGIVIQALNEIARGQIRVRPNEKSYGMQISEWHTPFGMINIVHNPLFIGNYAGYGYLLDMDCFEYCSLKNRDTKLETNIQAPDVDGQVDQYISEVGLKRVGPARCALLKGVEG
jgi:hypothetical protein